MNYSKLAKFLKNKKTNKQTMILDHDPKCKQHLESRD